MYTGPSVVQEEEESSIDFARIFDALLRHKKLYYKVLPITFVVGCIIMLGVPNYYNCTVKLAPELTGSKSTNSLSSLASQFGLQLGSSQMGGSEALFPTLYPELMNSVDFRTSLFLIPVHKSDDTEVMTYYDYLSNEQKSPWWSAAIGGTMKFIGSLFKGDEEEEGNDSINPFMLTKKQTAIVKALANKIVCDVDKKTLVITIDVTDQDPLICATIADSVKQRLQAFITEYRTSKARVDLEYNQTLFKEAKARYDKSRQLYATFVDANQDIILQSVRQKQVELENEMQLQYNAYTQVASHLLNAEAKLQEETPAFTTLQSATVPVIKAGPGRARTVLVYVFLAFLATSVWILYKEGELKPLLGLS